MSDIKHTPGPWHQGHTDHFSVESDNSDYLTWTAIWAGDQIIALPCSDRFDDHRTVDANSNLLSAAPDLLDAAIIAEEYIRGFEGDEMQDEIDDKLTILRAAIAKATGQ